MAATKGPKVLKTDNGAIFIQVDGPNTRPEYIGCADLDPIAEPGGGIDTLIRCFNPDGSGGWRALDYTTTPPDSVTTTITTLIAKTRQRLDEVRGCPVNIFVHQRESGQANLFTNYVRSTILAPSLVSDRTRNSMVMRESSETSTKAYAITAMPPVYEVFKRVTSRASIAEVSQINDISFCNQVRCLSDAGPAQRKCKVGFVAANALAGSASAVAGVWYTTDYGATWTQTAADPFGAAEHIAAVACFELDPTTTRVIVARGVTDAGNPAEIAYSDDFGTTWTNVNVGTTNGQFVQGPHGMFLLDGNHIWLATDGGYIYFSEDGGVSWTAQEEGNATSEDLNAVHFASDRIGYAAGGAGDVLRTIDGGFSWTKVSDPVNAVLNTIQTLDAQRAWSGSAAGRMYYTEDGGTTWNERTFSGNGVGAVNDIAFFSDLIGFMLHDNAGPVGRVFGTIDGGYTWEAITTVTNAGLNSLAICGSDDFWAVGNPSGGTGILVKGQPAP